MMNRHTPHAFARWTFALAGSALLLLCLADDAQAQRRTRVSACASGCTYSTIQEALDAAPDGATIELKAEVYEENIKIEKSVVLKGAGRGFTVLDGAGSRVIAISDTDGVSVTIEKLTITNGSANNSGGGIRAYQVLVLENVEVSANEASDYGGGIAFKGTSLTLRSSEVTGNTTGLDGGGIWMGEGNLTLEATTIHSNQGGPEGQGGNGGGVFLAGELSSEDSQITENYATYGGGLYSDSAAPVSLKNTVIADNEGTSSSWADWAFPAADVYPVVDLGGNSLPLTARLADGNLVTIDPTACLSGCTFSSIQEALDAVPDGTTIELKAEVYTENLSIAKPVTLKGAGRGLTVLDGARSRVISTDDTDGMSVTITDLTITNGVADKSGGGIRAYQELVLENVEVTSNEAVDYGGGIAFKGTSLTLRSSDVSNNTSGLNGGGIWVGEGNLTLEASTVRSNQGGPVGTGGDGGGVFLAGELSSEDSQITENYATYGGGIYSDSAAPVSLKNTVIADNEGTSGDYADWMFPAADVFPVVDLGGNSLPPTVKVSGTTYEVFVALLMAQDEPADFTISVCPDGSCDESTLAGALGRAVTGDIIYLEAGTYKNPGYPMTIDADQDQLTIRGAGAGATIIEGDGDVPTFVNYGHNTVFENLTVTGGTAGGYDAGGIWTAADIILFGVHVHGNSGGGIGLNGAGVEALIRDSTIEDDGTACVVIGGGIPPALVTDLSGNTDSDGTCSFD